MICLKATIDQVFFSPVKVTQKLKKKRLRVLLPLEFIQKKKKRKERMEEKM